MAGRDETAVTEAIAAATERLQGGSRGRLHVTGPAGSGKSAVLAGIAEAFPAALLIDVAGRSADSVVQELIDRTGVLRRRAFGTLDDLERALRRDRTARTVLLANTQLAGSLACGGEADRARAVVAALATSAQEGRLQLVVEQSQPPEPPPVEPTAYWLEVLRLPGGPGPEELAALTAAAPPQALAALRALANAQLRRVPVAAWAELCRAADVPFGEAELAALAADPLVREPDGTVGFDRPALVEELRYAPAEAAAFHGRMTDRLLTTIDLTAPWAARSLPGHAAAAGRFDELVEDARALAHVPQDALTEALRTAYGRSGGFRYGTPAAALRYLTGYGLAGAPHGEWVARLAHDAHTRGQFDRAEALAAACPEPLTFRTVWSRWRPIGAFTPRTEPWHTEEIDLVQAAELRGTPVVLIEDEEENRFLRDAATGASIHQEGDELGPGSAELTVRQKVGYAEILDGPDGAPLGLFHHPDADAAGAVGDLLVLAGVRGAYAVRPDVKLLRDAPEHRLVALVGSFGRQLPRPYDPADLPDLRQLLEQAFGAGQLHRIDPVPDGITHRPTRELLATVGLPAIDSPTGYWLTPADHLPARPWPDGVEPAGRGPFHLLGGWLGADLVLDGSDGRVLRMMPAHWPDTSRPREPLIGTTLERFLTLIAVQAQYLSAYWPREADSHDLLSELRTRLAGIDPDAAATDSWQHVLEPDTWA
ncbi:SUKH-4 family immunity protein [Kitasatospora sp. NPDC059673]|uniref:SUKH-4 family immunity protein n=1 Tax=Kitasatospora sp. NPDC059673 TaxID=3346901 RepID=UPI0036BCA50E